MTHPIFSFIFILMILLFLHFLHFSRFCLKFQKHCLTHLAVGFLGLEFYCCNLSTGHRCEDKTGLNCLKCHCLRGLTTSPVGKMEVPRQAPPLIPTAHVQGWRLSPLRRRTGTPTGNKPLLTCRPELRAEASRTAGVEKRSYREEQSLGRRLRWGRGGGEQDLDLSSRPKSEAGQNPLLS